MTCRTVICRSSLGDGFIDMREAVTPGGRTLNGISGLNLIQKPRIYPRPNPIDR